MPGHHPDSLVDITQKPVQCVSPIGIGEPKAEDIEKALPQAGMYTIELCDIRSPNIDETVNMIPMIETLTVYEDISKPYILCDIAIRDTYGFREIIPIIGEEFINLIAQTKGFEVAESETPLDNIIKKSFRVYSVSPIANTSERHKIYVLHCISIEAIISEKKKISKGYSNVMIENVVKDIYEKYIVEPMNTTYAAYKMASEPKRLIVEPTSDLHSFSIPFKSPFDIIDDLTEKATTAVAEEETEGDNAEEIAVADGALYMFYETLSHFKFESLETSFKRAPKRNFVAKIDGAMGAKDNFGGTPNPKGGWPGIAFNNVEEYQIDGIFDIIDNMRNGMYAAKLITHDIVRMRYDVIGYKYIEKKEDVPIEVEGPPGVFSSADIEGLTTDPSNKKLADNTLSLGQGMGKLCSYNHDCLIDDDSGEGARIKLMGTNFNHSFFLESNRKSVEGVGGAEPGIKETNLEWRTQKRDSQLQQLNNVKITLKLAGDSSLRVGDIIWWHMPSQVFVGSADSGTAEDPFLSGKYIMTKINHVFTNERYYQEIQIRKDSLQNTPPGVDVAELASYADESTRAVTAQRLKDLSAAVTTPSALNTGNIDPTDLKGKSGKKPNKGRPGVTRSGTPTVIYDAQSLAESQ